MQAANRAGLARAAATAPAGPLAAEACMEERRGAEAVLSELAGKAAASAAASLTVTAAAAQAPGGCQAWGWPQL